MEVVYLLFAISVFNRLSVGLSAKQYCQPGQECWPTLAEVEEFKSYLTPTNDDCHGFPTFSSIDEPGNINWNQNSKVQVSCKYFNQFIIWSSFTYAFILIGQYIWNRWYKDEPHLVKAYDLLNFRNHVTDRKGYFVVLAKTQNDVIESVKFASSHNIGVSVFSTGHEFNDRNSGPGENTLLIRTTCLQSAEFDLDEKNRFNHPDGIVRLGTGLTWGTGILGYKGY